MDCPNVAFPDFLPHRLLASPHLQTILASYWHGSVPKIEKRTHYVDADDGDRLALHEFLPEAWKPGDRVVLLVHGLGGSHASGYVRRVGARLYQRGMRVFAKDLRGFGDGAYVARGHIHAGRWQDVAACLATVRQQAPGSPITLVGFSLGANITLKMVGECGRNVPLGLDSAIAVAPPIDLLYCARNLRHGINRLYDWSFTQGLQQKLFERRKKIPDLIDAKISPLPRRLLEFDDLFTAPLLGFQGARHYYQEASSIGTLSCIDVPTLILAADDDPVIPPAMFDAANFSSKVDFRLTRGGGHLGWIGRKSGDPDNRWMDWRIVEWIEGLRKSLSAGSSMQHPALG
jgi:predicted alpha/beta-fold hydrolase